MIKHSSSYLVEFGLFDDLFSSVLKSKVVKKASSSSSSCTNADVLKGADTLECLLVLVLNLVLSSRSFDVVSLELMWSH